MMEKEHCKVGVKLLDAKDRAKLRCCTSHRRNVSNSLTKGKHLTQTNDGDY